MSPKSNLVLSLMAAPALANPITRGGEKSWADTSTLSYFVNGTAVWDSQGVVNPISTTPRQTPTKDNPKTTVRVTETPSVETVTMTVFYEPDSGTPQPWWTNTVTMTVGGAAAADTPSLPLPTHSIADGEDDEKDDDVEEEDEEEEDAEEDEDEDEKEEPETPSRPTLPKPTPTTSLTDDDSTPRTTLVTCTVGPNGQQPTDPRCHHAEEDELIVPKAVPTATATAATRHLMKVGGFPTVKVGISKYHFTSTLWAKLPKETGDRDEGEDGNEDGGKGRWRG